MNIKMIFLDIDGTILDYPSGLRVPADVKNAVRDAERRGIKVCLCSARPYFMMEEIAEELDINDAVVCSNGSEVLIGGKHVHLDSLGKDIPAACLRAGRALDIIVSFLTDEKVYVRQCGAYEDAEADEELESFLSVISDEKMDALLAGTEEFQGVYFFIDESISAETVIEKVKEELAERTDTVWIGMTGRDSIMVTWKDTNKATGMMKVAKEFGVSAGEIMAVGNDENDLSMIEAAGIGVAVGNATDEVKEKADYITADVWHSGVAEAIYRFTL